MTCRHTCSRCYAFHLSKFEVPWSSMPCSDACSKCSFIPNDLYESDEESATRPWTSAWLTKIVDSGQRYWLGDQWHLFKVCVVALICRQITSYCTSCSTSGEVLNQSRTTSSSKCHVCALLIPTDAKQCLDNSLSGESA